MTQREQTLNSEDQFLEELESSFREIMSEITETHRYDLKQELKSKLRNAMKEHAIKFNEWKIKNGWLYNEGFYYQPEEETPFLKTEQLYNKFNLNK